MLTSYSTIMKDAISESYEGIRHKHGGPFGSVVIDNNGNIVGRGHNQVLLNNDPTAHGEIQAIRSACKNLNTYDLSGCTLYTTAYPCPMCMSAIMWANIDKVIYLSKVDNTDSLGFRDGYMYKMFKEDNFEPELVEDTDKDNIDRFNEVIKRYVESNPITY